MTKILFLGGPSGVGKSTFCGDYLSEKRGWLWLEIDLQGKGDGLARLGLDEEWGYFFHRCIPDRFYNKLSEYAGAKWENVVLSLPSLVVFCPAQLSCGHGRFYFAYLYGRPDHCLQAFLKREKDRSNDFDAAFWNRHNCGSFARLSLAENHRLLIDAFNSNGTRRDPEQIYRDLLKIIDEPLLEDCP
jgi:hypothetical protein